MNRLTPAGSLILKLISLYTINPKSGHERFSTAFILREPTKSDPVMHPALPEPPREPNLAFDQGATRELRDSMSHEVWHKGIYAFSIDSSLRDIEPHQHLSHLRRLHVRLLSRYQLLKRRGAMDAGFQSELRELKLSVIWRSEVVEARISELEAYESGLKAAAKERYLKSTWGRAWHAMTKQAMWNLISFRCRDGR
ncbi:hypothetical protein F5Y05DRAFT_187728 [Hypoxylon sp. FL0543]|nr:hypothetical protein F5Y05DRAFT_187728 [Hypoxylon sp. FL0543]